MMNNHIAKKDIIDFVFSNDRAKPNIQKIAEINQHLLYCEECSSFYESLVSLQSEMEDSKIDNIKVLLLKTIFEKKRNLELAKELLNRFKQDIGITISSNERIEIINNLINNSFSHPKYQTLIVEKALDDRHKQQIDETNESILIADNNSTFLCLDEDMTFSVFYSKEKSDENDIIVLSNEESGKVYISELEEYDDDKYIAEFYDIEKGNYILYSTIQN